MLIGPTTRVPRAFLGMLVLVAAVEAMVGSFRHDLATPLAEDWRIAALAASAKAPGRDVLCFGDSLVKYGLLPRVIQARTGLKAYNLATSGGTMPSAYFLFRQALEAGARPRAVVADFAALMLEDPDPPALRDYAELASFRDCLDLARASGSGGFLAGVTLGKLLPSYQWRFEIRLALRGLPERPVASNRAWLMGFRSWWDRESGAQPMPPGRGRHPSEASLISGISPENWACSPRDESYLERFLALADSHRITVFWLIPPICPEARLCRVFRGSDLAYDRLVRRMIGRHPDVVVLDARPSGYDDSVYVDHMHLDRRGAAVLSGDVARVVADRSGRPGLGPGWLMMPLLAGRAADDPPTPLARSRAPEPR